MPTIIEVDHMLSTVDDDVIALAVQIMGSRDNAYVWLTSPAYGFGFQTPLDVLRTPEGKDAVIDELGRIAHGIPA